MYLQGSLAWLREYDLASGEDEVNEINYVPLGSWFLAFEFIFFKNVPLSPCKSCVSLLKPVFWQLMVQNLVQLALT